MNLLTHKYLNSPIKKEQVGKTLGKQLKKIISVQKSLQLKELISQNILNQYLSSIC